MTDLRQRLSVEHARMMQGKPQFPDVIEAAREAKLAAYGDSNDDEIEKLQSALDAALGALGIDIEVDDPADADD